MYLKKEYKYTNAVSYMDGKLKECIGEKCKVENVTFKQCQEFISKIKNDHSEEELLLLEDSLEINVDVYKQSGLKQTTLSIWSSILVGITVALFTFYNTHVQTLFTVFGKVHIENSKDKIKATNEIQKVFADSFNISLEQVATPSFYILLFAVSSICIFTIRSHNKGMRKSLFYNKIIKQCRKLKEKEESDTIIKS